MFPHPEHDQYDIMLMNEDGSGQVKLTDDAAADFDPAFSRDGTTVVFSSVRDGSVDLYTVRVPGAQEPDRASAPFAAKASAQPAQAALPLPVPQKLTTLAGEEKEPDWDHSSALPNTHFAAWRQRYLAPSESNQDEADFDGDGLTNLLEYAWGFDPKRPDDASRGLLVTVENIDGARRLVGRFRRDALAPDLTYALLVSTDLQTWTNLATSTAGMPTSGPGFLTDQEIEGDVPFRHVTARDTSEPSNTARRFMRLTVVPSR